MPENTATTKELASSTIPSQGERDREKEEFEKIERSLKIKNLKIDLWVKPLSFFSAIIAFTLAFVTINNYYQQNQKLEDERFILEEKIETSQTEISEKISLLLINVELINRGGDTIKPYAHALTNKPLYSNEGLYLVVYEIPTTPNRLIEEDEGTKVFGPHNMLKKYSNNARNWYDSYRIKPHTTYHEGEAIILERKKLYQVLVRFFVSSGVDSGWTITESRYVYIN